MPHDHVNVSRIYGSYTRVISWWESNASSLCYYYPHLQQLHESYILMIRQCLMFILLLAASTAVTQELYLGEKIMPHVHVIVSCIYGSTQELYLGEKTMAHVYVIVSCIYSSYTRVISWWENNASCLSLLAASERARKNPLKIKFQKDIVKSYKPIVWAEPWPISMLQDVSHLLNNHLFFYLAYSFAVWVCTLEPQQP